MANLTIKQTAKLLEASQGGVRKLLAERRLGYFRYGRAIRIPEEEISRFIRENTVPARPARQAR
jgi:excisionase family DNA binding protein